MRIVPARPWDKRDPEKHCENVQVPNGSYGQKAKKIMGCGEAVNT